MNRVLLISPGEPDECTLASFKGVYTADQLRAQNVQYARMLVRDSLLKDEAPFAPFLHYAAIDPALSTRALHQWAHAGVATMVFCVDLGITDDMRSSIATAELLGLDVMYRRIIQDRDPRPLLDTEIAREQRFHSGVMETSP